MIHLVSSQALRSLPANPNSSVYPLGFNTGKLQNSWIDFIVLIARGAAINSIGAFDVQLIKFIALFNRTNKKVHSMPCMQVLV